MAEKNIKNTHLNNLGILQFWICLHTIPGESVFRILSSVSCLLSSTQHAYPALLVPCALIFFVPLCLRGQDPRSTNHPFFCKTNPISKTPKPTQPLFPQRFTPVLRSAPPPKTNPNEPNVKVGKMNISIAAVKPYANEQRPMNNERYSKQTQFKPNSSPKLEPCSTLSEVEGPIKPNSISSRFHL